MKFTDQQLQAINSKSPRAIAMAVAGSGKTSMLIERINVLRETCPANKIMVCTFTIRAAENIKAKIPDLDWVGTIHSTFARILAMHGYDRTIIGEHEQDIIISQVISQCKAKTNPKKAKEAIKNQHLSDTDHMGYEEKTFLRHYLNKIERDKVIDYDGLEHAMLDLVTKSPYIFKNMFYHILVDEFQDSSKMQKDIFDRMALNSIFVVGDISQSIYGFRGAVAENMTDFEASAGDVIRMNQTHRMTKKIAEFDNAIMSLNNFGYINDMYSEKDGPDVTIIKTEENGSHLDMLSRYLNIYPNAFVICRTNHDVSVASSIIQEHTGIEVMNYVSIRNSMIYNVFLSYLNYLKNGNDRNLMIIFDTLGLITMQKSEILMTKASANGKTFREMLSEQDNYNIIKEVVDLSGRFMSITQQLEVLSNLVEFSSYSLVEPYAKELLLKAISNTVMLYGEDLYYILDLVQNISPQDIIGSDDSKIKVMTAHASKGLEEVLVIVWNVRDGMYPMGKGDIQEELRLFHVACTRAKVKLIIVQSGESKFLNAWTEYLKKKVV